MGLKPGSAHYSPRAKDGELPVFVNKVLLEHAIYLHIVYDSFQAVIAELSSCHVDHMACKTYNIYYSTIFQKNFATLKKKNQKQGGSLSRTYCHVRKIPKLRCVHSCMLSHFSHILLFVTLWTVARQAPLSIGFSRQEYWSGLPCPPLGYLPNPRMEPASRISPALAGGFFTTVLPGKP